MKSLDLGRPDVMFMLIWAGTTWLAYLDLYYMTFDRSVPITLLIAFNIISFFVMYAWAARRAGAPAMFPASLPDTSTTLERWTRYLCAGWLALFVWIVFRSGGVPAWWRFRHIDRSYVDFGVATVSGFANLLRSFLLCLSVLLWLQHRSRTALAVGSIVVASSLLEMARANVVYLLLCGLGVYLVHRRAGAKTLALMTGLAIASVLTFGLAEEYRSPGGSGGEKILEYPSVLNRLPYGVTSVYLYLTTPVSNLYYAEARGIQPLYAPYYSLELVLPTVIRGRLYTARDYPIAVRRVSHNATTFYAPLIADFGIVVAGLLVCLLQYVISHVHVRARRGDPYYQLIYGPLFAALALSFFFNYFLTLGVLLFPLVALPVRSASRSAPSSIS